MGDFNAQIGSDNTDNEQIKGKHALGTLNENGELLVDLCHAYNLTIGGSLFPHRRIHKISWVSPDHRTENQIDHILISQKWKRSLLDVRSYRGDDVGSNHHLLIGSVRLKVAAIKQRNSAKRLRFNIDLLKREDALLNFSSTLQEKATDFNMDGNINDSWNFVKQSLTDTAEEILGKKTVTRKPLILPGILFVIERRPKTK